MFGYPQPEKSIMQSRKMSLKEAQARDFDVCDKCF